MNSANSISDVSSYSLNTNYLSSSGPSVLTEREYLVKRIFHELINVISSKNLEALGNYIDDNSIDLIKIK